LGDVQPNGWVNKFLQKEKAAPTTSGKEEEEEER